MNNLSAIILAAGYGKRLGLLTKKTPKPLIKVNNISVIDYVITSLSIAKIPNLFINLHYLPLQVIEHLGSTSMVYSYEPKLLGTAGTVKALCGYQSDNFVVCNSDTIFTFDINEIMEAHLRYGNVATIAWDEENKRCAGVMIFSKRIYNILPQNGMIDDVLATIKYTKFYVSKDSYIDIGTPEGLAKANEIHTK